MAQNTKTTRKKKKRGHLTAVIFWLCLLLIIAPFGVLGWILFSSSMDSNAPVLGNRYQNDLNPAITKTQLEEVQAAVAEVPDVQKADIEMATATLRVYADVKDDADGIFCTIKSEEIYNVVKRILDPAIYFTQHDGMKMYDIEVHVYNRDTDMEADDFVYVIRVKNSSMAEAKPQLVSSPRNAALAEKLRKETEERIAREEAEKAAKEAEQDQEVDIPQEEIPEQEEGGETPSETGE